MIQTRGNVNEYVIKSCQNILNVLGMSHVSVTLVESGVEIDKRVGMCFDNGSIELYYCGKLEQGKWGQSRTLLHELSHYRDIARGRFTSLDKYFSLNDYKTAPDEMRAETFARHILRFCCQRTKVW
jgi:hypothetical protein